MSEEQKQPQQAEELTEWSEIDTSPSSEGKENLDKYSFISLIAPS